MVSFHLLRNSISSSTPLQCLLLVLSFVESIYCWFCDNAGAALVIVRSQTSKKSPLPCPGAPCVPVGTFRDWVNPNPACVLSFSEITAGFVLNPCGAICAAFGAALGL